MKKVVDGKEVEMTPDEVAARQAEEAEWAARRIPTNDEIDQSALNEALTAEGSVTRAMGDILFGVIKGTIPVTPSLTKQQFVTMLRAKMRT
jgi:hypothetical protein